MILLCYLILLYPGAMESLGSIATVRPTFSPVLASDCENNNIETTR